jgi:hypothetical protein
LRQIELARKRHEIESRYNKEQQAATKIQTAFRHYRHRQDLKQQEYDISLPFYSNKNLFSISFRHSNDE